MFLETLAFALTEGLQWEITKAMFQLPMSAEAGSFKTHPLLPFLLLEHSDLLLSQNYMDNCEWVRSKSTMDIDYVSRDGANAGIQVKLGYSPVVLLLSTLLSLSPS